MKKLVLLATALAMVSGSAFAADMRLKAVKAPPPPAFDPWDIAFGSAIMSDYVFRDPAQLRYALFSVEAVVLPASVLFLYFGLRPYGASVERAE